MNTKHTIIISAATCLVVNFALWLLGSLIWPIGFIAFWLGTGHLSWLIEKSYASWRHYEHILNSERIGHYLFGPIWMILNFFEYKESILSGKNWFPKIRNPFVWTKDDN